MLNKIAPVAILVIGVLSTAACTASTATSSAVPTPTPQIVYVTPSPTATPTPTPSPVVQAEAPNLSDCVFHDTRVFDATLSLPTVSDSVCDGLEAGTADFDRLDEPPTGSPVCTASMLGHPAEVWGPDAQAFCARVTEVDSTEAKPATPVTQKPITFTVKADKITKPFHIGTEAVTLRIKVKAPKSTCKYGLGSAFLFPKGEKTMYAGNVDVDGRCGSNESEAVDYDGPGDYYLQILDANSTVTVTVIPHN